MAALSRGVIGRAVNGLFALLLGLLGLAGFTGGEGFAATWPYFVMLPFFIIQAVFPTEIGWAVSIVVWAGLGLGVPVYQRLFMGANQFTNVFLLLWGVLPILILFCLNPKRNTA
jgi:hypothetical protein